MSGRRTGLSLSGTHLCEGRLHLGVERVSSHDENDGHVLINERERSVLELSGEDLSRQINSKLRQPGHSLTPSLCMYDTSLILRAPSRHVASGRQLDSYGDVAIVTYIGILVP